MTNEHILEMWEMWKKQFLQISNKHANKHLKMSHNKHLKMSMGDLVPVIMANALMINILLVIQNGTACDVQLLSPRCHVVSRYDFTKKREHYDAILSVDEQNID